jgi:hypothetical protein
MKEVMKDVMKDVVIDVMIDVVIDVMKDVVIDVMKDVVIDVMKDVMKLQIQVREMELCRGEDICRGGQNRIYIPYMTVYLVICLPKIPYIHRIYMVLANPRHLCV